MRVFRFVLLLAGMSFPQAAEKRAEFGFEIVQSPHTLRSVRIAPTINLENWRFSPGSFLYMESHGRARQSVDPIAGLALGALLLEIDAGDNRLGIGEFAGLIILGGLTCLPNAEYAVPVSLAGIRPSIFWSYNLLPVSWSGGDIEDVKKIGIGLRRRFGRFDVGAHFGVSDKGFGDTAGPAFGFASTFFLGRFKLPRSGGEPIPSN